VEVKVKYVMQNKLIILIWILALSTPVYTANIEKIEVKGNNKVSRDTLLFYMKSREKNVYSSQLLRQDFKSLWRTGFFENITIHSRDGSGPDNKIVTLTIKENPLIAKLTFKAGKKITEKVITDKLQENSILLATFSYYDPAKLKRSEKIIRDMLQKKGYNQGTVSVDVKESGPQQVDISIIVDQGPITRIGAIEFPGIGNSRVTTKFLLGGMKNNKRHSLFTLLGSNDVFNKEKIKEDIEGIKHRMKQKGYLEAKVGTPETSMFDQKSAFGKIQKMQRIHIPIQPGPQYRVGAITINGNKIVKSNYLKGLVTMKKGEVYNIKKRDKIREQIQQIYGNLGYIYSHVAPVENLDPAKKVADLTLNIQEGEVAYIGKLEFEGNTFTKDHVLRREWLLQEGKRFNSGWLKNCITRMKQQGLVDIAKEPEFKPDSKDPQKLDVKVHVKELNRQNINFNIGYSGYDGLFVALGYSTQNFMGLGETLGVNLQTGTKSYQYRLSFMEPYFLNLPANLGFSVHKTAADYYYYKRKSQGFDLTSSGRIWRFFRGSLRYRYEDVSVSDLDESLLEDSSYSLYYQDARISALSPTLYYSTVDSPMFPTTGNKILFTYQYSGGFLGGDVDMHKTKLQLQKFIPIGKRHVLGMQLVHQTLIPFGNKNVPNYEKFLIGGEQSIRGFEVQRISPRNENGWRVGGNKAFFFNLEYIVPLNQQISMALFYDIGNAYDFGQPISLKNVYSSTGLELRIFVPMLNVPFRLIFAYNPRTLEADDSKFVFRFAVGTSFN
jgi:outer membrane protein insertion porin family